MKNRYGRSILAAAVAQALSVGLAQANPTGPSVAHGSASLSASGKALTVTTAPGTVLNWQSFSIGAGELTRFQQSSALSAVLNRVVGRDPSSILGTLQSNGRVFLVNPHGIVFGRGSVIDTAGFVASTLNIADQDFLAGRLKFEGGGNGVLRNEGTLRASGDIFLVGPRIENTGLIRSDAGSVLLAAGQSVTITSPDAQGVQFALQAPTDSALNLGAIEAKNAAAMFAGTLRHSGEIRANRVALAASGEAILEAGSNIAASGAGASVLVWSDDKARVHGTMSAKGADGKGGFVETSARTIDLNGVRVDTGGGKWLIDPNDFTIAASGGNISGATLSANLSGGTVVINSSAGSAGSGDINVNDAVTWNANRLYLMAARDVNINAVMTASGTAILDINTSNPNGGDAAVPGGAVKVGMNGGGFTGRVDFPGRSGTGFLYINENAYTVINSLGAEGSVTGTDLQGINGNLAGFYALGSNVDASATSGWNAGAGFDPVGTTATPFTGQFNGLGHTIGNLTINRPTFSVNIGLFSLGNGAVANVGLTGGSVSGKEVTGGLMGRNDGVITNAYYAGNVIGTENTDMDSYGGLVGRNAGAIRNSFSTGSVSGDYDVGGLVGINYGTIVDSYSSGAVAGSGSYGGEIGGLVGRNFGTITGSYATGNVNGYENRIGGLVGYNALGSTITTSHATGAVTADNLGQRYIGGLVGQNDGTITDSHSIAEVQAFSYAGGLVGYNDGAISGSYSTGIVTTVYQFAGGIAGYNDIGASISTSYSTAYVRASEFAGGVAAWNTGAIADTYNTGNVNGLNGSAGGVVGVNEGPGSITRSYNAGSVAGTSNTGGLIGWFLGGTVANSYWDIETSGQSASPGGGTGLTTALMQTAATFGPSGANWNTAVWRLADGAYPALGAAVPSCAYGACWTGSASGDWSLASNWFGSHIPASGESVFIDAPGLITVTYFGASTSLLGSLVSNENFTLSSTAGGMTVSGATTFGSGTTFTLASGTATFNGAASLDSLDLQGGTLAGSGALTLNGASSTWSGGTTSGSASTTIAAGAALAINGMNVGGAGTLTNLGTLNLANSSLAGSLDNQATLNVSGASAVNGAALAQTGGSLNLAAGATLTKSGGTFDWNGGAIAGTGTLTMAGGAAFNITGTAARVLNGPTLNLGGLTLPGGSLELQSGALNLTAASTINAGASLIASGGSISSTSTMDVAGTLRTGAGSVSATGITIASTGLLIGDGTVAGNVTNNGTVAPGNSAGTLTINGSYTQGAGGTLDIELNGTAAGQYDVLVVSGTATLNGTVNFSGAAASGSFPFLTASSIGGTFASQTGMLNPTLAYNAANLTATLGALGIFWDGGGNDGMWLTPANWSGDALPTSTDDVIIGASAGTVTLGSGASSARSLLANTDFVLSSSTTSLVLVNSGTFNANLRLNAGTTLTSQGTLDLNTYTLGAGAKINLARSGAGVLSIGGLPYVVINSLGAAGSTTGLDLQGMAGNLAARYALGSDIDAAATAGWNIGAGFTPVGNDSANFTGTFDGLGHAVRSLTINRPAGDYIGLFGYTSGAAIKHGGVENSTIRGRQTVGALAGYNAGTITNAYADADVTSSGCCGYVGGLVGINAGSIASAHSGGSVTGRSDYDDGIVGGLVGWNNFGSVDTSYSTSSVTGNKYVGGLVGAVFGGSIANSYSTGNVVGRASSEDYGFNNRIGGLAGYVSGSLVSNSYATGSVRGGGMVGGLIGHNSAGTVSNSYAIGAVTGAYDWVGGLVGLNTGAVTRSYATGNVQGRDGVGGLVGVNADVGNISGASSAGTVIGVDNVGGLVGRNAFVISNSYSTSNVTGSNKVGGLVGLGDGGSVLIEDTYATGRVHGITHVGGLLGYQNYGAISTSYSVGRVTGNSSVGGLIGGATPGSIGNAYWGVDSSGQVGSAGGTGLSSAQMSQQGNFNGWDFAGIWGIEQGASYPYLLANPQIPHPVGGPAYYDSERATALGLPANDVRALTDQFFAAVSGINLPEDEREKGTALVCK